jgi:hypothetical protein
MTKDYSDIFEEMARIGYMFGDYQDCIDGNSQAMRLKPAG